LLEQQRNFILHTKKDAAKVDVQNAVPLLLFEFRYRCVSLFDACVVEGKIQPPERLHRLVQSRLDVFASRHIALDGERMPAFFLDKARRFLAALFRNVRNRHARAFARKRQRRSTSDAASCSGNKRDTTRIKFNLLHCHLVLY